MPRRKSKGRLAEQQEKIAEAQRKLAEMEAEKNAAKEQRQKGVVGLLKLKIMRNYGEDA